MKLPSARRPWLLLGIMSGTSLDGVDCALCRVALRSVALERHWHAAFPRPLQARLHAVACGSATSWETAQIHHDLGRFYVRAVQTGLGQALPVGIGLHGQTVFHRPDGPSPATLQLGDAAWLVEAFRVPVVSNFRSGDLAAGGQGAPLATLFHQVVFGRPRQFICVNNLGGISNVTALNQRPHTAPRILAFDTGPGNVLLDMAMRHFTRGRQTCDRGGEQAARGKVHPRLLADWLKHPYFRRPPPKSTGRELFGEPFWARALKDIERRRLSVPDAMATLTALTAESVAMNYRLHLGGSPDRVVLAGGGAANPILVRRIEEALRARFPRMTLVTSEQLGWPAEAIESSAFALLAHRRLLELPGNIPATTGAARPVLLGQIALP